MRKKTLIALVFGIGFLTFTSCKSMKGCGLTSDAQKVTPTTVHITDQEIVAD